MTRLSLLSSCGIALLQKTSITVLAIATVLVAGCSSSFRLPDQDIIIHFDSFEYLTANEQELIFDARGRLTNTNELEVRPISFTYQLSIDGQFYENNEIKPQLQPNGKLYFKSNTPFRIPIDLSYEALGGIGKAMKRQSVPYSFSFQFFDERGNRSSLTHDGTINMNVLLRPVEFTQPRIASNGRTFALTFSMVNSNNFEIAVSGCSYTVLTDQATITNAFELPWAVIDEQTEERIRVESEGTMVIGDPFIFEGSCVIDGETFVSSVPGVIR